MMRGNPFAQALGHVNLMADVINAGRIPEEQPKKTFVYRKGGATLSSTVNATCWIVLRDDDFKGMVLTVDDEVVAEGTGIPTWVQTNWPKSLKQAENIIAKHERERK